MPSAISDQVLVRSYARLSNWAKILLFAALWLAVLAIARRWGVRSALDRDGFRAQQGNHDLIIREGLDIYDDFYAGVYDHLFFSSAKVDYEIEEIIKRTTPSDRQSTADQRILDIGCGTGHHVDGFVRSKMFTSVIGADRSASMVAQAKETYPDRADLFQQADGLNRDAFSPASFTHIACLYFTIYYMTAQEKQIFYRNCMEWLQPGGFFIVHLADRDLFDPILPPGNPLILVSPQKYAEERILHTEVHFDDFLYSADFSATEYDLAERFKDKESDRVRKQTHQLHMETLKREVDGIRSAGFVDKAIVDLIHVQYEYQYVYIFVKPHE